MIFENDAWVENPDDEMKQRAMIHKLEKKIDRVLSILKKKEGHELKMDSLIFEAERIEKERDSLFALIENERSVVSKEIGKRITFLVGEIKTIKEKYFEMRRSRNKWRKTAIISIGGNIILFFLLF